MKYDPFKHHRRSIRLRGYDYSQAGAYFVTMVVKNRENLFGDIVNGEMRLNGAGRVVVECWDALPAHLPNVGLDAFEVMPNHAHGILVIGDDDVATGRGGVTPPLQTPPLQIAPKRTVGQIVAYFKYESTKRINQSRGAAGTLVWQRNYYERIVRNEKSINAVRNYIAKNPVNWTRDEENQR